MENSAETTTNRPDTATRCHCGGYYNGSDHCPECGCEQYESGDCGHTAKFIVARMPYATAGGNRWHVISEATDVHVAHHRTEDAACRAAGIPVRQPGGSRQQRLLAGARRRR